MYRHSTHFRNPEKIEQTREVVPKLKNMIGKKGVEELLKLMDEKKYFEFSRKMLEDYYDPRYSHGVKGFTFEKEISSEDIDDCVIEVEKFCKDI